MGGIIDAHAHLYPPEMAADPRGWAQRNGEEGWADVVGPTGGRPSLQRWPTPGRLLRDMDEAGVERVILQGWYWRRGGSCSGQNRWYAALAKSHPDRISWFATVQPMDGPSALEELKRAVGEGAIGMGELSPAAQGFCVRGADFTALADWASQAGLPILFHVNEALGRNHPGRNRDRLDDFQWLASSYPRLKLILAHWGGLIPFFELNPVVRRDLKNVVYDTAASPLLYDARIYRQAIGAVGAEKILFGSDYPLLLYPKKENNPGFRLFLEEIRSELGDGEDLSAVLAGNARRFFGWI